MASTTKSMTSLLVATHVDDGTLSWDQPVIDAWPDFRAPTDELTQTLRVRDLLGMDSGLGAPGVRGLPPGLSNGPGASALARLPTRARSAPHGLLLQQPGLRSGRLPGPAGAGADPVDLLSAYGQLMQDRFFGPAGMSSARIADDPRPFSDDYATGYALDLAAGIVAEPLVPVGSSAPVGGTLASLIDMAAYVSLQLNHGVSPAAHPSSQRGTLPRPGSRTLTSPFPLDLQPDVASTGYAMGWNVDTFPAGRRLISHTGGVDGFVSYIGFLPDDDLGLVVLTNVWLSPGAFSSTPTS